jgi:DNA-binding winged helix-turn-helix (wHTH) protein
VTKSVLVAADPMADRSSVCPHCGADLLPAKEKQLVRGTFMFRPGDGMYVGGKRLRCGARVHKVIGLIFRAAPEIVSKEVIASRLRYTGSTPIRLVDVYLTQARRAARELGEELPVSTVIGQGVRWGEPSS